MAKGNGHLEWESSKDERYAENWWTKHGYSWRLIKRFVSKSVYEVSDGETTVEYSIPNVANMNMKRFMEGPAGFTSYVELWKANKEANKAAKEAGLI